MVDARGPTDRTGRGNRTRTPASPALAIALGLIALGLLIALILAFLFWRDDDSGLTANPENTTVGAISEDPQAYIGERVIVSGEVSQILTPFSYIIGGEQFVGGGELLVVDMPPAASSGELTEDEEVFQQDIVQVSGEVREFGPDTLEGEDVSGFEGNPVLHAEVIQIFE